MKLIKLPLIFILILVVTACAPPKQEKKSKPTIEDVKIDKTDKNKNTEDNQDKKEKTTIVTPKTPQTPAKVTVTISGTITGLRDDIILTTAQYTEIIEHPKSSFSFESPIGETFELTISTASQRQDCQPSQQHFNGQKDVSTVVITCTKIYTIDDVIYDHSNAFNQCVEKTYSSSTMLAKYIKHIICIPCDSFTLLTDTNKLPESCTKTKINTLSGIQHYTALEMLTVNGHGISAVNLSTNPLLKEVNLSGGPLRSFTDNTSPSKLENLNLNDNDLTSINLASFKKLKTLELSDNNILNIDTSANIELEYIDLSKNNRLQRPDFSKNTKLKERNILLPEHLKSQSIYVNGAVRGIGEDSIVIAAGGEEQLVSGTGAFQFKLPAGQAFTVTLPEKPANIVCEIDRPTHPGNTNVDSIIVVCIERTKITKLLADYPTNNFLKCVAAEHANKTYTHEVESITCENKSITHTQGLEYFIKVKTLILSNNPQLFSMNLSNSRKLETLRLAQTLIIQVDENSFPLLTDLVLPKPTLALIQTNNSVWVWDDSGSGGWWTWRIYDPKGPDGTYMMGTVPARNVFSGWAWDRWDVAWPSYPWLVVKDQPPLTAKPTGYDKVYTDAGTGAYNDLGIWRPKAPSNYFCLGDVANRSHHNPPSNDAIRCVHKDFVSFSDSGLGRKLWSDSLTGGYEDIYPYRCNGESGLNPYTFRTITRRSYDNNLDLSCKSFKRDRVSVTASADAPNYTNDIEAPSLTDFNLTSTTININNGESEIKASLTVSDNQNLQSVEIWFTSTSGQVVRGYKDLTQLTDKTSTAEIVVPIGSFAESGLWRATKIQIYDRSFNERRLLSQYLLDQNYTIDLTVTNSNSDSQKPLLSDFTVTPNNIDTSQGEPEITYDFSVSDNLSGLKTVEVMIKSPSGEDQTTSFTEAELGGISHDKTRKIKLKKSLGQSEFEEGIWRILAVSLTDKADNYNPLASYDLERDGYAIDINITDHSKDQLGPTLTTFNMAPAQIDIPNGNKELSVQLSVSDNLSGLGLAEAILQSPSNKTVSGSKQLNGLIDQALTIPIAFSDDSENGTWSIKSITLKDKAQNTTVFSKSDLATRNFKTEIPVLGIIPDNDAPSITQLQIASSEVNIASDNKKISITLTTLDNKALKNVVITLKRTSDQQTISLTSTLNGSKQQTLTLEKTLTVSDMGSWQIHSISITDEASNSLVKNKDALISDGYTVGFNVTNS